MIIHPTSMNREEALDIAIARGKQLEIMNPDYKVTIIDQVGTESSQIAVGFLSKNNSQEGGNQEIEGIVNYWDMLEVFVYKTSLGDKLSPTGTI